VRRFGGNLNRGNTVQSRFVGRLTGLSLLFLLLTVVATPASATDQQKPLPTLPGAPTATPTDGGGSEPALVFDGVLAVRFMTADGTPLAGAQVIVKAFPGEGAAFAAQQRTNHSGVATFTGLPRPGTVAPFVWTIDAKLSVTSVSGRCTTVTEYAGSAEQLASAAARAIPVIAESVRRSQTCGAEPSPRGGNKNAPPPGGDQPGGASGGGAGGSAPGTPGLTPPATNTELLEGSGGAPLEGLLLMLLAGCALILRLAPRRA
jgi:hypothetical protein